MSEATTLPTKPQTLPKLFWSLTASVVFSHLRHPKLKLRLSLTKSLAELLAKAILEAWISWCCINRIYLVIRFRQNMNKPNLLDRLIGWTGRNRIESVNPVFGFLFQFRNSFFKKWTIAGLLFSLFPTLRQLTVNVFIINCAVDWIRTAGLWYLKWSLCQLSHNHFPKYRS